MSGILKDVVYLEDFEIEDKYHPILMKFIKDDNDSIVYPYRTSLEEQFCSASEIKKGLLDDDAEKKMAIIKTKKGKKFDVNLYRISVSELTDGKFVALDDLDSYEEDSLIREFRRATYKTREDLSILLKLDICISGMESRFVGINKEGDEIDIDSTLIFPIETKDPKKLKNYDIPYEGFPEVDEQYILFKMPLENIKIGQYLALFLKYDKIKNFDGDYLIERLKEYRNKKNEIENRNNSVYKRFAFWEQKEQISLFNPTAGTVIDCNRDTVIQFFRDSFILSKTYPKDCLIAKNDYYRKCEEDLRERFLGEEKGEKRVKDKRKEILKEQSLKYSGKRKLRIMD